MSVDKSHQLSFVNSSTRARKTFDLVHSNLWGASHVPSVIGACYFLLFINDHTQFSWLYLLKTKDETFSTFLKFKAMVEIQFSSKINALQSDWEGEYKPFSTHLHNLSIKHKVSCPYTPQQNGCAERKNCYVVEMVSQSLLIVMLLCLFGPLPSKPVFFLSISFPLLFYLTTHHMNAPKYDFLKTFGCAFYPLLHPYKKH